MVCPSALLVSITAAAVALAEGKSIEEIDLLSAILVQLADSLATISAQKSLCEAKKDSKDIKNEKS